jgi:hypothetical protein
VTEPLDLEKHRHTITERLATLSKELEHTHAGTKAVAEFASLLHTLIDNIEQRFMLHKAEMLLTNKLMLADVRFATSWEDYQARCLKFEKDQGYLKK